MSLRFLIFCFLLFGCQKKEETVAILLPVSHPSLEAIEMGFKESFPEGTEFKTFNAQGDLTILKQQTVVASKGEYQAIFAIGAQAALMAKKSLEAAHKATPLIYGAVMAPEELGLEGTIGSIESTDYRQFFRQAPFDHFKKILIPYDPGGWKLSAMAQEAKKCLEERGVVCHLVEVFSTREVKQKVSPFLEGVDAILLLKDNTVIVALDTLKKMCAKKNITLITSDLDSFQRGADFCFGVEEKEYGKLAALLYLEGKQQPQAVTNYRWEAR